MLHMENSASAWSVYTAFTHLDICMGVPLLSHCNVQLQYSQVFAGHAESV